MKIAITSTGKTLDSQVDQRLGRAEYFVIIDTETMDFEVIENDSATAGGGAGISAAKVIADAGAEAVLTGNCGPNAQRTLSATGVKLYTGLTGTLSEAVELYNAGKVTEASEANVQSHFGMDK